MPWSKDKATTRTMQVGLLWMDGKTLKEIGRELKISYRTVETYINILRKRYSVRNKVEMMKAIQKAHPDRPCPCCGRTQKNLKEVRYPVKETE